MLTIILFKKCHYTLYNLHGDFTLMKLFYVGLLYDPVIYCWKATGEQLIAQNRIIHTSVHHGGQLGLQ